MSRTITIRPDRFRNFGPADDGTFCLVTNPDLMEVFEIAPCEGYSDFAVVPYDQGQSFDDLLDREIPEPAHVLVVSPRCFVQSPRPDRLGPRRKLIAVPCNSTPTSIEALAHFLDAVERTDPADEAAFADRFFTLGQRSAHLTFVDDQHETKAVFHHLDEDYQWNQQAGAIEWGEQQIAPSGELSVLPADIMNFDPALRLAIDGEIAFKGELAVHSGTPSFHPDDQARVYDRLSAIRNHAVIATVEQGVITRVRPSHRGAQPAADMFEALFEVDSRYRLIWECGFGINRALRLLPGNHGMNEPFGGTNGVSHWGLGLTPYTQYALIIICPGTRVLCSNGELLVGPPEAERADKPRGMVRRKVAGCGCYPS